MAINSGDKITNEPFNNSTDGFFTKLEAIRQEHYNKTHNSALASSFTTDPNTEEGELATNSPFLLMQTYLQTLRNSAYISGTGIDYAAQIPVPTSGELLNLAGNVENTIDSVITDIDNICPHDSNMSNKSHRSSNRSNRSNDSPVFNSRTFSSNIW